MSIKEASPASEQSATSANSGASTDNSDPLTSAISTRYEHVICQAILAEEFARIFGGEL
tara:strand:- start:6255 stop:6431 length:177 start_codon:yes stop_codon:yes gene_type:complete